MGTFGNTSAIGASSGRQDGLLSKFTVPEACTVTDITIYLKDARSATSMNVAIYAHDAVNDLPGALLAQGTPQSITTANNATWITFSGFSVALNAGDIVWLGGRGNAKMGMLWTTGTKLVDTLGANTTTWADPYDVGGSSWALDLAIYATYTAGGGAFDETGRSLNIVSATGTSDAQKYKDLNRYLAINAGMSIVDAAAYLESLANVILSGINGTDAKKYTEQLLDLYGSAVALSDRQKYKELLSSIAVAVVGVSDNLTGQLLENLSVVIASQTMFSDLKSGLESVGLTIASLTTLIDSGKFTESGAVAAFVQNGLTDIGHYLEPGAGWELETVNKNTAYDLPALPNGGLANWILDFLVFVPEAITANTQMIVHAGGQYVYINGKTLVLNDAISLDAIPGRWNHVQVEMIYNNHPGNQYTRDRTYLRVNDQSNYSDGVINSDTSHYYYLIYNNGSGYQVPFGDPGYKISKLSGAYNMGNAWQDAAKTIPANNGDSINTIETARGDAVLVSGYTPGIKRTFSQYFKALPAVSDVAAYIDTLSVTGKMIIRVLDTLVGQVLEQLGIVITSVTGATDAAGYIETVNFTINDAIAGADVQNFVENVLSGWAATISINDAALLAERLSMLVQSSLAESDRQAYIDQVTAILTDVIGIADTYTPNDYPLARYEFIYRRLSSFKVAAINRHFTQDKVNRHIEQPAKNRHIINAAINRHIKNGKVQ